MDEVGRGSWAGPVVVGAVVLDVPIIGLKDSKLLSRKQRELFASVICAEACAWNLGLASAQEIDEVGLTQALKLAYQRAIDGIVVAYDRIVIDGNYAFLPAMYNVELIIKADQLVPSVSAASIIAKVARDELMRTAAIDYPGYGFEKHVGYGTAVHAASLAKQGPCALHRQTVAPVRRAISSVST
jgi:ribonuclease HII